MLSLSHFGMEIVVIALRGKSAQSRGQKLQEGLVVVECFDMLQVIRLGDQKFES